MRYIKRITEIVFWLSVLLPLVWVFPPSGGFAPMMPPSASHLLGTDRLGRDMLSVLMYAWHGTVVLALVASAAAVVLSVAVALLSLPRPLTPAVDAFLDALGSIPRLLVLILIGMFVPPTFWWLAGAVAATAAIPMARALSDALRDIRRQPFVESARAVGVSGLRFIVNYLLRPAIPIIMAQWAVTFGWSVYADGALAFLGVGDASRPSLGTILRHAITIPGIFHTTAFFRCLLPPILLISLTYGCAIYRAHMRR